MCLAHHNTRLAFPRSTQTHSVPHLAHSPSQPHNSFKKLPVSPLEMMCLLWFFFFSCVVFNCLDKVGDSGLSPDVQAFFLMVVCEETCLVRKSELRKQALWEKGNSRCLYQLERAPRCRKLKCYRKAPSWWARNDRTLCCMRLPGMLLQDFNVPVESQLNAGIHPTPHLPKSVSTHFQSWKDLRLKISQITQLQVTFCVPFDILI